MPHGATPDSSQTLTTVVNLQTQQDLFPRRTAREINEGSKQNGIIG